MADDLAARVALPVIDGERCVHAAQVRASCNACVKACPRQALILNDQGLFIEPIECDGCGVCAAVCPEGAVTVPVESAMDDAPSAFRAFAACHSAPLSGAGRPQPQTAGAKGPALVPCLHDLGLEALAELYRRGVRELAVAEAPCETCVSGCAPRLAARVSSFNGLLSPQSMDQVRIVELPPIEWLRRRDATIDAARAATRAALEAGTAPARRALLTVRAAPDSYPAKGCETAGQLCSAPPLPSLAALLLENGSCDLTAALPRIDAQLCTGCLACVSACPHDVFALITRPGGRRELLVADGRRCTGCSLCADACPANCISVERESAVGSAGIVFGQAFCRACSAAFRLPVVRADGRALCPNCRSVSRQARAVQVIR
jgi:NAD-dependent dihydropyrimidine dehydrogenase PreA subunit